MDKKHFDSFQQAISLEQLNQRTFLEESRAVLASAPPGRLFIRERSNSQTPYQIVKEKTPNGWSNCSRNLKRDPDTLLALAEKIWGCACSQKKAANRQTPIRLLPSSSF